MPLGITSGYRPGVVGASSSRPAGSIGAWSLGAVGRETHISVCPVVSGWPLLLRTHSHCRQYNASMQQQVDIVH